MEISIRRYTPDDLDAVAAIWHDGWASTGMNALIAPQHLTSLEDLRQRLPRDIAGGWEVFVACRHAIPVAFLAMSPNYVHQLFVVPGAQSQGIGKTLLDFAKQSFPQGFALTTPTASLRAIAFYEREGLIAGHRDIHPRHGLERIHFRWAPQPEKPPALGEASGPS